MTNAADRTAAVAAADESQQHRWLMELAARRTIELIYFAHIDQADWADHVLAKHGIGRPHHRVLYFADKKPGISVRELMAVLRISNQALARTTNQLVTLGFLEQRYSMADRRIRQHLVTNKGATLLAKLTKHQVARVAEALETLGEAGIDGMWHGLEALTRPEDRSWILDHPRSRLVPAADKSQVAYLKRSERPARSGK